MWSLMIDVATAELPTNGTGTLRAVGAGSRTELEAGMGHVSRLRLRRG